MSLNILILEPYYTGSHRKWADDLVCHSKHSIDIIAMPGRFWKWRMEGSAIYLSEKMNAIKNLPDLVLCSSMLDLGFLKGLLGKYWQDIPYVYYLHENQLTYPISDFDRNYGGKDMHYGFINLKSCLIADSVLFNSQYHKTNFISAASELMNRLPDFRFHHLETTLLSKSEILPLGIDFQRIDNIDCAKLDQRIDPTPILLWNHRWEHDKRPEHFLDLCKKLLEEGFSFKIRFLGQNHDQVPDFIRDFHSSYSMIFDYFGYAANYDDYIRLLKGSDILPVSSDHDFFGISVIEALYCGLSPVLPANMVYHEHLPDGYAHCFYEGQDAFIRKTKIASSTLSTFNYAPVNQHLRSLYEMRSVIDRYDNFFKKKVHEYHAP